MTADHEDTSELFGLAGTFPRPGWVVLDAAREHLFTGELVFDTVPEVRVYVDRGRIYLAERSSDPSLGARLVDAGALNAAQLEHGSLRLGDSEHLGRLFERVPSVDRHAVLVTAELMTEECVGWLAGQQVRDASATPYRHHPSGVHRWERPADWPDLAPGDPLPAPSPDDVPVEVVPPEPLFSPMESFDDGMIQWEEPGWLDERPRRSTPEPPPSPGGTASTSPSTVTTIGPRSLPPARAPGALGTSRPAPLSPGELSVDWIDRLDSTGLPEPGSDPLASVRRLPSVPVEPLDRFELIWPSGEIDEQFGAGEIATLDERHPDLDRAGPTARVQRLAPPLPPPPAAGSAVEPVVGPELVEAVDIRPGHEGDVTDEVVLAVRRAVASIETPTPVVRRRPTAPPTGDASAADEAGRSAQLVPPGRVAVREEHRAWTATGRAKSVFDEPVLPAADDESPTVEAPADQPQERAGALRRLITGLRRR